jgi:hypothetical protein
MRSSGREIDFLGLGSKLEGEFLLLRDVKLTLEYPYLNEAACLIQTALDTGATARFDEIGIRNLGEYLLLLRQGDEGAESIYSLCAEFIDSKVRR